MKKSLRKMAPRHRAGPAPLTHIRELIPDPANRRTHNPRNVGMLVDALQKVGASRSIVIDEDGLILAGNGVVEAASEAGITRLQVVDVDGDTVVAVRRRGLTPAQKRELAIYDNRTAELAEWNLEQLAADLQNGEDLTAFFYEDELKTLLAGSEGVTAGRTDPDAVPQERPTGIVAGDLFELGAHRLLCGDCTVQGDVARLLGNVVPLLMVTDPPYGVEYDATWRGKAGHATLGKNRTGRVASDDRSDWRETWALFSGSIAYIWHGGLHSATVAASLEVVGFTLRAQIIWNKTVMVMGRGDYHWKHEPCWYAVRGTGNWSADRTQTTVWDLASPIHIMSGSDEEKTAHPTQKPAECMLRPIRNHGGKDDHVYDPFVGSGTTIIAAEQLGRQCFAMELTPTYCQMAIDRWEAFTGQKAVKVGEAVRA